MFISPVEINDIPALVTLVNNAYRGENAKKGWTTEADLLDGARTDEESLKEMLLRPGAVILKCTNTRGDIAASVYLQKQDATLYLGMLTVAPDVQAMGIGKLLLKAAEEHAVNVNCATIRMTVISVRNELICWYERHGYSKTGETEPFPPDVRFGIPKQHLEFVVMAKGLKV